MSTWQYLSNDDRDEIERQQRAWERWAQELEAENARLRAALGERKVAEFEAVLRLIKDGDDDYWWALDGIPEQTQWELGANTRYRICVYALAPESASDATKTATTPPKGE